MALVDPALRALYDLKVNRIEFHLSTCYPFIHLLQVFVQCDSDLMLARRIKRDVKERGRDVGGILDQ